MACAALTVGCGAYDTDKGTGGGAGSSSSNNNGMACDLPTMRKWVNDNMNDYYLFADQVPTVRLSDYDDVESLIKALRVAPFDTFSYIDDAASSTAFFEEGKLFSFGWRLKWTSQQDLQFTMINPNSPVSKFDVRRGDFLRAINGVSVIDITNEQINQFLGTGDDVVSPTITVQRGTGPTFDVTVTKATFQLQTVLETDVVQEGNQRIGYLHFLSFLETSAAELDAAFQYFASENINELVLDLRYNGGGRIDIAGKLASQIAGSIVRNKTFTSFEYNKKYAADNVSFGFPDEPLALDLNRVFVLTTGNSCSASELVINSLRPFIDVVTVGGTTCGKPYGSRSDEACGKAMHALRLSVVNSDGVGNYYDGIAADCPLDENLNDTLGTPTEALFSSAIEYIRSGSCLALATTRQAFDIPTEQILSPSMIDKQGLLR